MIDIKYIKEKPDEVVARLAITGNNATLAGHKVADSVATYAFARENVKGFDVDYNFYPKQGKYNCLVYRWQLRC